MTFNSTLDRHNPQAKLQQAIDRLNNLFDRVVVTKNGVVGKLWSYNNEATTATLDITWTEEDPTFIDVPAEDIQHVVVSMREAVLEHAGSLQPGQGHWYTNSDNTRNMVAKLAERDRLCYITHGHVNSGHHPKGRHTVYFHAIGTKYVLRLEYMRESTRRYYGAGKKLTWGREEA